MRIAVFISGRITSEKSQYENLLNMLQPLSNEVDFFICYQKDTKMEVVEKVVDLYQPKKIIPNDEIYFPIQKYRVSPESISHNIMSMYRSRYLLKKTFEEYVSETNSTYEVGISTRMDLVYEQNQWIGHFLFPDIVNHSLFIPSGNDWNGGLNDQLAVGNIPTLLHYLNVYDSLFELLESGIILHPETLMKKYLEHKKQPIIRFPLKYYINRKCIDFI